MIVKRVSSRDGRGLAGVGALIDYVRSGEADERILYQGARGFLSRDPEVQRAEMLARAHGALRSAQPVAHWVLSWREGEQPDARHVEEAVDVLLEETGLRGHPVIHVLHGDTENVHLHVVVNRARPDGSVVKVNRGFDLEALHRALARIERLQGWEPEAGARYEVAPDGVVVPRDRGATGRRISARARDIERRTGAESAERLAQRLARPVCRAAASWQDLHQGLAAVGCRYERRGQGAVIVVALDTGEVAVKASRVGRTCGFGRMQARLGPYQPITGGVLEVVPVTPGPARTGIDPMVLEAYRAWRADERRRRAKAEAELAERERLALAELAAHHRAERDALDKVPERGMVWRILRRVMVEGQARARAELRARWAEERQRLSARRQRLVDFEGWLRRQGLEEMAERLRMAGAGEGRLGQASDHDPEQPGMALAL